MENNNKRNNGRIGLSKNTASSNNKYNMEASIDNRNSMASRSFATEAGKDNTPSTKDAQLREINNQREKDAQPRSGKSRNKKLTAIIVGSALAFVLTVVLTVTITLAFFGGTATGAGDITMGGPVNVNDTVIDNVDVAGALPGQKINLNAQTTVTTTAPNPTNAILRAYFTWTVADGAEIAPPTIPTTAFDLNGTADAKWTKHGDFYYLTNVDDTNMAVIDLAVADGNTKTIALVNNYQLAEELTNDVADKQITISVEFTALQAQLPVGEDGALTDTVSMEQSRTYFNGISTTDDTDAIA